MLMTLPYVPTNHTEASDLLTKLNQAGVEKGLSLNVKKTKLIHIGKHCSPILIGQEEVEKVDHFKYLGSIKTEDAYCSKDIRARIGMAKQRMVELTNIWKASSISTSLKIRLMKCLVWTVVTYGAEGWTLRKEDMDRINSAEMWMYRRLLRVSWYEKRTNDSILRQLQVDRELLSTVLKRKLTFFGHTIRNKKCSLMKTVIQGKIEAKRKPGRPRTHYFENIKQWTGKTTPGVYGPWTEEMNGV